MCTVERSTIGIFSRNSDRLSLNPGSISYIRKYVKKDFHYAVCIKQTDYFVNYG